MAKQLQPWKILTFLLVITAIVAVLQRWTDDHNLPGQNVLVPLTAMLVLAYQAHILKMRYARNNLLALVFSLSAVSPNYSEPGSYSPIAYMSYVLESTFFWSITMILIILLQMTN